MARGEVGVGVSFVHEFITQQLAGFPVDIAIPCEGTGDALGGMAIIANGPNPADARTFYDWALTRGAQELANRTRNPDPARQQAGRRSGRRRRGIRGRRRSTSIRRRSGSPAEKKRLLARWQREIGDALK